MLVKLFVGDAKTLVTGFPGETIGDQRLVYVFNGDLCDRGQSGVQIVFAIALFKVVAPDCVYVNRGNHESGLFSLRTDVDDKSSLFMAELKKKYPLSFKELYEPV